jgi:predicted transcriptional regulator
MAKKESKEAEKKPTKDNELAVKILAVMADLRRNGVTETNSTTLRDKVGTKNRAVIRRAMKGLAETGMVVISEKKVGKRERYTYKLA